MSAVVSFLEGLGAKGLAVMVLAGFIFYANGFLTTVVFVVAWFIVSNGLDIIIDRRAKKKPAAAPPPEEPLGDLRNDPDIISTLRAVVVVLVIGSYFTGWFGNRPPFTNRPLRPYLDALGEGKGPTDEDVDMSWLKDYPAFVAAMPGKYPNGFETEITDEAGTKVGLFTINKSGEGQFLAAMFHDVKLDGGNTDTTVTVVLLMVDRNLDGLLDGACDVTSGEVTASNISTFPYAKPAEDASGMWNLLMPQLISKTR